MSYVVRRREAGVGWTKAAEARGVAEPSITVVLIGSRLARNQSGWSWLTEEQRRRPNPALQQTAGA
jgi:hypothetical protein